MSDVVSAAGFHVPVTKRQTDLIAVFKVSDARTVIVLFFTNSLQAQEPFHYNGLFSCLSETINPPPSSGQGLLSAPPFGPWTRPPILSSWDWNHHVVKAVEEETTTAIKQKQRYRTMGDVSGREKSSGIKGNEKNFLQPRHTSIHKLHFVFQIVSSFSLKTWKFSFLWKVHDFQVDVRAPDALPTASH